MGGALVVAASALVLAPWPAGAHFVLQTPPSWMSQDALGSPQKLGPCGDEAGGTPTGTVTAYQSGQTITITINETIFHPGHYRIALAVNDRSELPPEPPVTPNATPCGTVPIDPAPAFPVLADGVLAHTSPFSGPQTVQVTLPANVTCTHCTLQVIEFMSNHPLNMPGGCFYHHCADLSIQSVLVDAGAEDVAVPPDASMDAASADAGVMHDAGMASDAGARDADATPDAGGTEGSRGCGCAVPAGARRSAPWGVVGLALVVGWLRRRRAARR